MSYVILNGMYEGDSFIPLIERAISEEFKKKNINGESIILNEQDIKPCLGCFKCWVQTPGICIINDYGREVTKKNIQSDYLIYLSPIVYGGYSAELKKALDRAICLISPFFRVYHDEIHHEQRYDKYPKFLVFGILPNADSEQEEIFNELVERNVLNNFAPDHASTIIYQSDDDATIERKTKECLAIVGDMSV